MPAVLRRAGDHPVCASASWLSGRAPTLPRRHGRGRRPPATHPHPPARRSRRRTRRGWRRRRAREARYGNASSPTSAVWKPSPRATGAHAHAARRAPGEMATRPVAGPGALRAACIPIRSPPITAPGPRAAGAGTGRQRRVRDGPRRAGRRRFAAACRCISRNC